MQSGTVHNSSPCVDCVAHFNKMLHTIKYLVYTTKDDGNPFGYSMEKVHYRDYNPTLTTSGKLYIQRLLNTA